MIPPGGTLGILGGGQLGRMFAFEAKRMGYRVSVFTPGENTPAGQVADSETSSSFEDAEALRSFSQSVDVVTVEFENIPVTALAALAELGPVHPSPDVLHVAQNRLREKTFLAEHGLPVTPFRKLAVADDIRLATETLGLPAVMKTAGFGYDGKGQRVVATLEEAEAAFEDLGGGPLILEAFVSYTQELSVVAARTEKGGYADFGVIENEHRHHILDVSTAPSDLPGEVQREAKELARAVLEALAVVGVLCVEFFLTEDHTLLINEIAPRPHNSGHLTIEAHAMSQFEQQVRAVCGLPLGRTELVRPAAMANLLGELWRAGEPNWAQVLALPDVHLHLYGKAEARAGRKMGHLTALGTTVAEARNRVVQARSQLGEQRV